MAKNKGVMTDTQYKLLNELIKDCTETAAHCQGCNDCGIDVDKEAKRNADQLETAKRLKAKFFPNRP